MKADVRNIKQVTFRLKRLFITYGTYFAVDRMRSGFASQLISLIFI